MTPLNSDHTNPQVPASTIKPIVALVGSDPFLQLQKINEIVAESAGSARIDFDGERADLRDVLDEVRSFAMFAPSKVVVVQNADAFLTNFRSQLEDYAAAPATNATLVLRLNSLPSNQRIYKAIAKTGRIDKCDPPKDVAKWIIEHGRIAHKITVAPDAARMLADLIGDSLGLLDGELSKLALNTPSGKIGPQEIANAVVFQRQRQMSEMTNAVAAGKTADALRKWRQMVQADPAVEFRAVTWLTIWLTNVRKALAMRRAGSNPFAIAQTLRIWPSELQKPFMQTAIALGDAGAARAIHQLALLDRQTKTGVGNAANNVERFILAMGNATN